MSEDASQARCGFQCRPIQCPCSGKRSSYYLAQDSRLIFQLAYYEKHESPYVDAVYAPPELFCFGADKVITKLEQPSDVMTREKDGPSDSESLFWWIEKRTCIERLGNMPVHVFVDALLISGTSKRLAAYPALTSSSQYRNRNPIKDAADTIANAGGSVPRLCAQNTEPALKDVYMDQYKRAIAGIKFHIMMTADGAGIKGGDIAPLDKTNAPSDLHDVIGLSFARRAIPLSLPWYGPTSNLEHVDIWHLLYYSAYCWRRQRCVSDTGSDTAGSPQTASDFITS